MAPDPTENGLSAADVSFFRNAVGRYETRYRLAAIGDDNLFTGLHRFDQLRQAVLGFEDIDLHAASVIQVHDLAR